MIGVLQGDGQLKSPKGPARQCERVNEASLCYSREWANCGEAGPQTQKHWALHIQHTSGDRFSNLSKVAQNMNLFMEFSDVLKTFKPNKRCPRTPTGSQSIHFEHLTDFMFQLSHLIIASLIFSEYSLLLLFEKLLFVLRKMTIEEAVILERVFLWTSYREPLKCILGNIFICKALNLHNPGRYKTLFSSGQSPWSWVKSPSKDPSQQDIYLGF